MTDVSRIDSPASTGTSTPPKPTKKKAVRVFIALASSALVIGGLIWFVRRGKETTDDAQVEGHVVSVASRVPGQVAKVLVKDNEAVKAGQPIVELDKSELLARVDVATADNLSAQASVELARAQLELTEANAQAGLRQARGGVVQATSGVASNKAQLEQAKSDVSAAEVRLRLATLDLERVRELHKNGTISQAEFDVRQATYDQAAAGLEQARARFDAVKASITGGYGTVEQARGRLTAAQTAPQQVQSARAQLALAEARFQQTKAALELARLNLAFATIRAPIDGVIARRNVEPGAMVSPERPLLAVVALDDVWIVANFKEDQIGAMRPGQVAEVSLDTLGGRAFRGHVESLAAGTGSRFALLPPDNASGNFVKVVQRVPVLLRVDDRGGFAWRPGMSAEVTVRVE
ncbi:MAG: HlyD family secretion protein [Polyangiaceae bacterium]